MFGHLLQVDRKYPIKLLLDLDMKILKRQVFGSTSTDIFVSGKILVLLELEFLSKLLVGVFIL